MAISATVLTREVHVATYKGEIAAMSYSDSSEAGVPEITTLIAKPKGLVPSQTTTVKGGGSSLLERLVQRYKAKYEDKIRHKCLVNIIIYWAVLSIHFHRHPQIPIPIRNQIQVHFSSLV
jgi:hypothetical protein